MELEQELRKYAKLLKATHDDSQFEEQVACACAWVGKLPAKIAAKPVGRKQVSPLSVLCSLVRSAADRDIFFHPRQLACIQEKARVALSEKGNKHEYRKQWEKLRFMLYECVDETLQPRPKKKSQDEDGGPDIKRQRPHEGRDETVESVKLMMGTVTDCCPGKNLCRKGYIIRDINSQGRTTSEKYYFNEFDLPDQEWDDNIHVGSRVTFRFGRSNPSIYKTEFTDEDYFHAESVMVLSGDADDGLEVFEERSRRELMSRLRGDDEISFSLKELSTMIKPEIDSFSFILDLVVAWGIYRESVRIARNGEREALVVFEKKLKKMKPEHASRTKDIVEKRFVTLKDTEITMSEIFKKTHFTNVFHEDDHCNQTLSRVTIRPEISVVVASLCYWTGDRDFVEMLMQQLESQQGHQNDIISDPESFFLHTLTKHLRNLDWNAPKDQKLPALFHRRYRPKLLWDNLYRGIMADSLHEGSTSSETCKALLRFAMDHLRANALPLAKAAAQVVMATTYDELFVNIQKHVRDTKERDFHAKNLANLLEFEILGGEAGKESDKNGLGPGFRALAHIRHGHGKTDKRMSQEELETELSAATEYVQARWPSSRSKRRVPKRRHVQSMYCETSKFFYVVKHGYPAHTCIRGLVPITARGLEQLAKQRAARGS
eukprot:TRINITY_DN43389_c0_g1_i1.p1 TRINITY_DN43389_c0_g1~~TRINITY_DN43389_c0_g1_i1.p1  ORF type:complete len:660 (+),score=117.34 TRINITY_DN43389_c0_g1_i1:81-2060(+)